MKPIRTILLIVGILVAGIAANTAVAHPSPYNVESLVASDHGNKHKDKHKNKDKHRNNCHRHDAPKGKMYRHAARQRG